MITRSRLVAAVLLLLSLVVVACGGGDTATPRVLGVSIAPGVREVAVGDSVPLSATVEVVGDASRSVSWSSSDNSIAQVSASSGIVTGMAPGVVTITARAQADAARSDSVAFTVVPATDPEPARGRVSGTVSVAHLGASARLTDGVGLPARRDPRSLAHDDVGAPEIVAGEVIVGFAQGVAMSTLTHLTVAGARLDVIRPLALDGTVLYRAQGIDEAATLQLAAALEARADVAFAHPNYWLRALKVPNDPLYPQQWHYPRINLPAAWDITTGSATTVVAVVDSGILHSFSDPSLTHPDLQGKVVPGYDFVSSPVHSGDGTGRDPDPYEVYPVDHGTHVAGTIAARTDDGAGAAGVDWEARILPVRVLGPEGGSMADVIDGTLWAAGFDVAGVPRNDNPAHVINLSLGGVGPCPMAFQQAFDRIRNESPRNAVAIVAAGNDATDTWSFAPANCGNAITVGATDYRDDRAVYSNYGTHIDVMAPGGDVTANVSGFGNDGVLSVSFGGAPGTFGHARYQGTSMAAPHVAGVVALMKALEPDITLDQAMTALTSTARPLTAAECGRPSSRDCGAGLIDAAAALATVRDGEPPVPPAGTLTFDPTRLDFGASEGPLSVALGNPGTTALTWEATVFIESDTNPGAMLDDAVLMSDLSGTIAAGGSQVVQVELDHDLVTADGRYAFALVFEAGGREWLLLASFSKGDLTAPALSGPMIVGAFLERPDGELVESGFQEASTFFTSFSFEVLAGTNWLIAWSDENDNLTIDEGDYIGFLPVPVEVAGGEEVSGIEIVLEPVKGFLARDAVTQGVAALAATTPGTAPHEPPWHAVEAAFLRARDVER